ncbi:MAG: beta strand repeat-containing protein [Terriglobales bacterium]
MKAFRNPGRGVMVLFVWLVLLQPCPAQNAELLSVNSAGTGTGNGPSPLGPNCTVVRQCVSSDGRFVVFESDASDLVPTDTNGQGDVFVRDRLTGTTLLVSVNLAGTDGGNAISDDPVISPDGTKVAFVSGASDLVSNDTQLFPDVFVRDLVAGTTTLVSVNTLGTSSSTGSAGPFLSFSADGTRLAFASSASDLVTIADTSFLADVFVRDLIAGTTTLLSINSAGTATGNAASGGAIISADGQHAVLVSSASDLVATDTNGTQDVFVRDLVAGTTALASVNSAGTDSGNGISVFTAGLGISADGQRVVFDSVASDLVANDTNGAVSDVFVRDLAMGTTTLVSVNLAGTGSGNAFSTRATMNPAGTHVAFESNASDLVATDTNSGGVLGVTDVFVRDLAAGATTLVSVNSAGTDSGNAPSVNPAISDDGTRVAFDTIANDLGGTVPVLGAPNTYARDLAAGTSTLASVNMTGTASPALFPSVPALSADGSAVVFDTEAFDLVATPDTNGLLDVFGFALAPTAVPDISINDVSVTEGNAGTTVATFTVSLSAASASTVTVDFLTNGVTATSGTDFVAGSGTVTFAPTDVSEPVTITINGDTLDELDETFTVDLSNPSNATILDGQGVGTITDDDPPPTLSISDATVTEGDAGATNASFTVSLSAASGLPVSVDFTTLDGSATQPGDYTLTTGTLVIPANTLSAPILVPVAGDTAIEGNETFTVSLSLPVNATIADGTATGTITDNDGQDFTLTSVECCIECVAGFKATYHLTIAPVSTPVTSPVALSCSGLPSFSTCTFTPASVTPGSSPANAVMLIETTGSAGSPGSASLQRRSPIFALWLGGGGLGLMGLVLAGRGGRRRKLRAGVAAVLALLTLSLGGLSCAASGPSTPPGTYPITITATGANFTHTLEVTLIVRD